MNVQPEAEAITAQRPRLASLDVWRGLVVVLMAVDHAAAFHGIHPLPEGLAMFGMRLRPDFDGFFPWVTRFITHYCAPGFVFLAGASVALLAASRLARGLSQGAITAHIAFRGLLLIALEYTLVKWGWGFALPQPMFGVLACIGACLVCGSVLRFAPAPAAALAGVALLFGHPVLADPEVFGVADELAGSWRRILLEPEPLANEWASLYPVLPWLAVFLLGLAFGKGVADQPAAILRATPWLAAAMLLGWLGLRLSDGLGEQVLAWTDGAVVGLGNLTPYDPDRGWTDFVMMSKYPPAADFVLWTLGGGLLFVAAIRERAQGAAWGALRLFGRVPLFFYVVHLYVYRYLSTWFGGGHDGSASLWMVWLVWFAGLGVLFPLCVGFARLKRRYPGFPLDLF